MRLLHRILLIFLFLGPLDLSWGEASPNSPAHSYVNLSDPQWENAVAHFESSIPIVVSLLEKEQAHLKELQSDIEKLEQKTAAIRQSSSGSNVFDEIRLKGLLNELKGKLEENSNLQRKWEGKQKEKSKDD